MDALYDLYWKIVDDNQLGIAGKICNRIIRKIVKKHLDIKTKNLFIKHPVKNGVNITKQRERKLICSLTSFPSRIDEIWLSIETIFRQTIQADEIILWLAKEQFLDKQLPKSILSCIDKGLTIRWVRDDLRSHKKYYYALQEYENADIVLLDDDLYYPDKLLENLISMAHRHPETICATRIHKMTYKRDGSYNPYSKWIHNYNPCHENSSEDYFFTSGAGTLIPTGLMPPDTFNQVVFKKICFFADDIWLNMQAKNAGIKIFSNNVYDKDLISIGKTQCEKLVATNVINGGNDKQLNEVIKYLARNE